MDGPIDAWVLTDGKAGDEMQCLGVVEALGLVPQIRRVAPRRPYDLLMPWGPIDPAEDYHRPDSPIRRPFPDLVVASGRRAIPYVRAVKRLSKGKTFTVILKDPRTGARAADLIWVPEHDRLRGDNVLVSVTSPHRMAPGKLAAARILPDRRIAHLFSPRVGVLIGGNSRHHTFNETDMAILAYRLDMLAEAGVALMGTVSRRTPPELLAKVQPVFIRHGGYLWTGEGENPMISILANADAFVITADSVNMVSEAAATGRPILVYEPSGGHRKITAFLDRLRSQGIVHVFDGRLEGMPYEPLDSTIMIADTIRARMLARGQAL